MIRLYDRQVIWSDDLETSIISEHILAGKNMWNEGKDCFKRDISKDTANIQLVPVVDKNKEICCYAYQDNEADRELRMLKELEKTADALRFQEVYPRIQEVTVYGCNELAYYFVRYLKAQQITVKTVGKYWSCFGYEEDGKSDVRDAYRLAVYAEGMMLGGTDLYQTVKRSVSPEFECIDRIYEANVAAGRIKDARGNINDFLGELKGREVVLLGTDCRTQDTYDFLYEHGIDICCFAEWEEAGKNNIRRMLLGKTVESVEKIINSKADAVFIDSGEANGALGTESVELFDYYGFGRNEQFFLIRDYIEVPCTNLLHVLKDKKVLFWGDEQLCSLLIDYLGEAGNINSMYVKLPFEEVVEETDILCVVNPWFDYWGKTLKSNPKVWSIQEALMKKEIVSYTDYFSQMQVLVLADLYRNRGRKKYDLKEICPKGILLGKIPVVSGNVFFRGILDEHPNILKWTYTAINNNLFLYCIRLAGERAENILAAFKKMCQEELAFRIEDEFTCWDEFERRFEELLSLKESFTSQELFVILHIAYAEMLCGYRITDLNQKIIYWEPHHFSRRDIPFMAQWLEDAQMCGQTICIHRDMVIWTGSYYKFFAGKPSARYFVPGGGLTEEVTMKESGCMYWGEFHVRFEDLKLHPQKELRRLCDRVGIPWSDTMLQVTEQGQEKGYDGIYGFDLKPVFHRYEEFLSGFDRFRLSIIGSLYQKKYGYVYERCEEFSRRELQEMFLKEFRFQKELCFGSPKEEKAYFLHMQKVLRKLLWEVRKYTVMDIIEPVLGEVEIGEAIAKKKKRVKAAGWKEWDRLLEFIRRQERLVLYGTGRDCEGLLGHLDEKEQSGLIFSDLKAEYAEMFFHGRKVIAPGELCEKFRDYRILITSSQFYETMQRKLEDMGVAKDRIICNTYQLWM